MTQIITPIVGQVWRAKAKTHEGQRIRITAEPDERGIGLCETIDSYRPGGWSPFEVRVLLENWELES